MPHCFYFTNHKEIYFFFNKEKNTLETDSGSFVEVPSSVDEITYDTIYDLIEKLKDVVIFDFETKYNIDLHEYD